jgi:hypothetical protein
MALEMLIIVNEVTINRGVEPATEVPSIERATKSGRKARGLRDRVDTQVAIWTSSTV